MGRSFGSSHRVAVVQWVSRDGIAGAIQHELDNLGYETILFSPADALPADVDVVFSFGPYGDFLEIPRRVAGLPVERRPRFVHWNTEGLPDLRLPWSLMARIGAWRSWMSRPDGAGQVWRAARALVLPGLDQRMSRFRYLGDYRYAHSREWLQVFADSSAIYAALHRRNGLPAIFAPWGTTSLWYADLGLERDIDVLWLGTRGSTRRSRLLDRVRGELEARGAKVHVADGVENPFIFGSARTRMLNRAKITLNLTRTWYDDNYSRFAMVAPNRSLFISEPLLPHCPCVKAGQHYITAPIDHLAETIHHYLEDDRAREEVVERAYRLATTDLRFTDSINRIMSAALQHTTTPARLRATV